MKSTLALFALLAAFVSVATVTASGQSVLKKDVLAGQLLDQLNLQKTFDSTFDSIPKMMQAQMPASQSLTPEQQDKFNLQMQRSVAAAKAELNWTTIKPIFVKIYSDNFEEADLAGMIAFYKTPLGQKWIARQPMLQAATMQAMGQLMPKIQAAMMKAAAQPDQH